MWDGVGKMAVDAINMRDYPIIQAYVMWMAIIYVLVNLIATSARVEKILACPPTRTRENRSRP